MQIHYQNNISPFDEKFVFLRLQICKAIEAFFSGNLPAMFV